MVKTFWQVINIYKEEDGSRIEPCGIPHFTRLSDDITSPNWHFCESLVNVWMVGVFDVY
jgi:hypothetical protein